MWAHLKDLMHDGQRFRWPIVRNYHAVWLQHIEQGRATWGDEVTRLDICRYHMKPLKCRGHGRAGVWVAKAALRIAEVWRWQ